jgi:putative NADH-flavin reductase
VKILVLGASGAVGKHAVRIAAERGHDVTALARANSAVPEHARVTVVRGEVSAPGVLRDLVKGHDAIISGLGLRRKTGSPFAEMTSAHDFVSTTTRLIIAAMQEHGVKRVLQVSAAGVAESAPRMNFVMKFLVAKSNIGHAYRDLAVVERMYAESGLDWCCVRPVTLTNGPQTERVRVVDHFGLTMQIARADVAWWMVARAEDGALEPRTPQIARAP